jgi:steroid Delta-isomerase
LRTCSTRSRARASGCATHLRFAADGRIVYHRDYWDAAEEPYAKLPVLGAVVRALQRRGRA